MIEIRDAAQTALEEKYPKLFTTNEQITEFRNQEREKRKQDPEFKKLIDETTAAHRAQQAYLREHDAKLKRLLDAVANQRANR